MTRRIAALALFAFALSLATASAQPLTQQERDALGKHLDQTRQAFLASIAGLSDAQWTFKAAPDRWSIAEVAEHIAVSETTIRELVTGQVMKGPAVPRNADPMADQAMVTLLLDRSNRFQAPEMLKPTNRWASRDALVKEFVAARDKTAAYVKTTTDELRTHAAPHPVFKMLDGYQWLLLLSGHAARHTAQIEEVKAAPGYPAK